MSKIKDKILAAEDTNSEFDYYVGLKNKLEELSNKKDKTPEDFNEFIKLNEEIEKIEDNKLQKMEDDFLNPDKEDLEIRNKIVDREDIYNANIEYQKYLNDLQENAELFNEDELEKLKTEVAFDEYLNLSDEQKLKLFPLSFKDDELDDFDFDYSEDDRLNDLLIEEEKETIIDFD